MTAGDRYDVSGLPEAQFEPGSNGLVLKNLLGITSKHDMDEAEARALEQAVDTFANRTDVVHALAETHVELVLILPFRDGNGRLARVLSTLMALQAGLPLLDFSLMAGLRHHALM
jgi:fido (protein-threonine AMPylation protein)